MAWKRITRAALAGGAVLASVSLLVAATNNSELPALLASIKQVGTKGEGNRQAQAACQRLAAADAGQLPTILNALDDASPLAANWLRGTAEVIVARQIANGGTLPTAALEAFLLDRGHAPRSRRLAYEWLLRVDPGAAERLLPGMLDDPSLEMRRDAVARLLDGARAKVDSEPATAKAGYEQALTAARDLDQIQGAIKALGGLGERINLTEQLGFLTHWQVVGPFDNVGGVGFAAVYPPEKKIDLAAKYDGKGEPVHWLEAEASDEMGHVDLNKALGTHKGAVAYAYAEFTSDRDQPVELRLGSANANKIWLNGKQLAEFKIYHSFTTMDQYVGRGELKRGVNQILVKLCQNEQTEEWAAEWKFQLRVADPTGGAIREGKQP
ncbi:MAG TPA: hypothetical protein VMF30_16065 [Pirellulales bacterium]|nr:hypothetical protein [Pirellulales bacterium]